MYDNNNNIIMEPKLKVIEFVSKKFSKQQLKYHINTKELYAIYDITNKYRKYLYKDYDIYCDNKNVIDLYEKIKKVKKALTQHITDG